MLRSQTAQPVRASVKNKSLMASSVGGRRTSQLSPPSPVASRAPLPPTAQPRRSSTKKTACSHANEPVFCFDHAACAEGKRQKAKGKRLKATASRRAIQPRDARSSLLPFAFYLLPSMLEPAAREDAREAEDGKQLHDLLERLVAVAGDDDLVAGAQKVVVGGLPLLDCGNVNRYRLQMTISTPVQHDDLAFVARR